MLVLQGGIGRTGPIGIGSYWSERSERNDGGNAERRRTFVWISGGHRRGAAMAGSSPRAGRSTPRPPTWALRPGATGDTDHLMGNAGAPLRPTATDQAQGPRRAAAGALRECAVVCHLSPQDIESKRLLSTSPSEQCAQASERAKRVRLIRAQSHAFQPASDSGSTNCAARSRLCPKTEDTGNRITLPMRIRFRAIALRCVKPTTFQDGRRWQQDHASRCSSNSVFETSPFMPESPGTQGVKQVASPMTSDKQRSCTHVDPSLPYCALAGSCGQTHGRANETRPPWQHLPGLAPDRCCTTLPLSPQSPKCYTEATMSIRAPIITIAAASIAFALAACCGLAAKPDDMEAEQSLALFSKGSFSVDNRTSSETARRVGDVLAKAAQAANIDRLELEPAYSICRMPPISPGAHSLNRALYTEISIWTDIAAPVDYIEFPFHARPRSLDSCLKFARSVADLDNSVVLATLRIAFHTSGETEFLSGSIMALAVQEDALDLSGPAARGAWERIAQLRSLNSRFPALLAALLPHLPLNNLALLKLDVGHTQDVGVALWFTKSLPRERATQLAGEVLREPATNGYAWHATGTQVLSFYPRDRASAIR